MIEKENENPVEKLPKNYLAMSIIAVVLGVMAYGTYLSFALGVIALIFSFQVDTKIKQDDIYGAKSAASVAKILGIVSIAISTIYLLFVGGFYLMILLPYFSLL